MPTRTFPNPLTLDALGRCDAPSLAPCQQPTSLKLLKAADTYQQVCVKYPGLAVFHSYAEYIHALWLESLSTVSAFVPQPFLLYCDHRRYIPDCYVVKDHEIVVLELKAGGNMEWPDPGLVRAFLALEHMNFEVIANDDVLIHEQEALRWRPIIQALAVANHYQVDTTTAEIDLLQLFSNDREYQVGDLLSPLNREERSDHEIALFRLIHKHRLVVDLSHHQLDYDTPVTLCI